jgi:hypothetical protein
VCTPRWVTSSMAGHTNSFGAALGFRLKGIVLGTGAFDVWDVCGGTGAA